MHDAPAARLQPSAGVVVAAFGTSRASPSYHFISTGAPAASTDFQTFPMQCQTWSDCHIQHILDRMSAPFLVKLDALGFPNPHAFDARDPQQYRTLVVFLENEKVRCLPPADRGCLLKYFLRCSLASPNNYAYQV